MYRHLVSTQDSGAPGSVHLSDYPQVDETLVDETLSSEMNTAAALVSTALGLRKTEQIRVRQPLRNMIVVSKQGEVARALERFRDLILDELNIKALELRDSNDGLAESEDFKGMETAWGSLYLETRLTEELRREGIARDVVRQVQQLRKEMDLNIEDRIHLRYATEDKQTAKAVEGWSDYIAGESLSVSVKADLAEGESKEVKIAGAKLRLQIQKA